MTAPTRACVPLSPDVVERSSADVVEHSCDSDAARRALCIGRMIKNNRTRAFSVTERVGMKKNARKNFCVRNNGLRSLMEDVLIEALPPKTDFACAAGFAATDLTHVFYGKCTCKSCSFCEVNYGFLGPLRSAWRKDPLTWRQLEAMLFVADTQKAIVDQAADFLKRASEEYGCKGMFARASPLAEKAAASLSKERKAHEAMMVDIQAKCPRARILWARVRRHVRMRAYARWVWAHRFGAPL